MGEQENGLNFTDGADLYDFSWETMTEDVVKGEIRSLGSQINKVSKLLHDFSSCNNYEAVSKEYNDLINGQLGTNNVVQQYYSTNQSFFEPYLKNDSKPSGFYDMPLEKQKLFDFALKCQRDASQCIKPLDQIRQLMLSFPLYHVFKVLQATMNLDDAGFDESLYEEINTDIKDISALVDRNWTAMDNIADRAAYQYFNEHYGKMDLDKLRAGYRDKRLYDYKMAFEAYCSKSVKNFKCNEYCAFSADLQYLVSLQVIDEYMDVVADALKEDIIGDLENCITESKKLNAVIDSRYKNCSTKYFQSVLTDLEVLNRHLFELMDYALDISKNYKNKVSAAPYCFMSKPPACNSATTKYGFIQFNSDPLSKGTNYMQVMKSAQLALTRHCYDYVYCHGRKEMLT